MNGGVMAERPGRKTKIGSVISNKMDKTIVVAVDSRAQHPLYKKIVKKTIKFKAHDDKNECQIGDIVKIMETKPMSREKRWRVVSVMEKAK
jgi:small subunit ribosomal protein S17